MDISDGKTKEIWGRKFRIVKNGLDEAEVFAFIGGLIEQNNILSHKLEHLDSLTRLAERSIIEADKEAQNIKRQIEEKANSQAAIIIAEAEERAKTEANNVIAEARLVAERQAQNIIKDAENKAETIKAQANEEANRAIAEAKENAAKIEQGARDALKAAEEKAEAIRSEADKNASKILAEAKEKAEELFKARRENAEEEAKRIIKEAKDKAEQEAHLIRQKSEQLLKKSRKIAESEIREKLKKVYQGLLASLEGIEEATVMPGLEEHEGTRIDEAEAEASRLIEAATMAKEVELVVEQPSTIQKGKKEKEREATKSPALYEGAVELVIPPPLGLDRMLQLHKHLRNIPNAKVLNLGVAADKSITIRVLLESPTPLLDILTELPEVEEASDAQQQGPEIIATTRKGGDKASVRRILVSTKK
jgi:vacuolar-type H+-ATPase subunit H